jgi:transcriptional regulator with XRE-family HTH domain
MGATVIDIDQHVANRIRGRRRALGLTLKEVADLGGLKLQQVHRYEIGAHRVSAASLWRLAQALEVEPNYFFNGLAGAHEPRHDAEVRSFRVAATG